MKEFYDDFMMWMGGTKNQVTDDVITKGTMLYNKMEKQMDGLMSGDDTCGVKYSFYDALKCCLTEDICECISLHALQMLLARYDDLEKQFIKELYMQRLGITDENTLNIAEQFKLSGVLCYDCVYRLKPLWPKYITIEDKYSFVKRKREEARKYAKQRKKERMEKKFKQEEGDQKWGKQEQLAFKRACEEKFGPLTPIPRLQKPSQNHEK